MIIGAVWGGISFVGMLGLTYDEINWINTLLYLPAIGSYLVLGSPILLWFIFLWIFTICFNLNYENHPSGITIIIQISALVNTFVYPDDNDFDRTQPMSIGIRIFTFLNAVYSVLTLRATPQNAGSPNVLRVSLILSLLGLICNLYNCIYLLNLTNLIFYKKT